MHLCIAASLDAPCWAVCWAIAGQVKVATENPKATRTKSLFAGLMILPPWLRWAAPNCVLREPRTDH